MKRTFRNKFYGFRYGHSTADAAGIIVSLPSIRLTGYGLTKQGMEGVVASALKHANDFGPVHLICASSYLCARQTALEAAPWLKTENIEIADSLRDRFMGGLEGEPDTLYAEIWEWDANPGMYGFDDMETPPEVERRMMSVIEDLEARYQSLEIVLVSDGESLDILYSVLHGLDPGDHRGQPFAQAEIRRLA